MGEHDNNLGLELGVVTEYQVLSSGRTVTVHRCAYPSEGPLHLRSGERHCLAYMYAHFVFTWPAGRSLVHIGHGTIDNSMPLWRDHPIPGTWCPESLVEFDQTWTRRHLAACQPPQEGDHRA